MFANEYVHATFVRIGLYLREAFGDAVSADDDSRVLRVRRGSAEVLVTVLPWGAREAIVRARACLLRAVHIDCELTEFLVRENSRLTFGGYSIDADDSVWLEYSMLGSTCDREECWAAIEAIAATADTVDDSIAARWGGSPVKLEDL